MALLTDSHLSQAFAAHIQTVNAETATALTSILTPYLSIVDFHQIAHFFSQEAMRIFQAHTTHTVSSRTQHAATCTLVFRIDSFFAHGLPSVSATHIPMMEEPAAASSASAAHALYVFQPHTRTLSKSTFHSDTRSLTREEEAALLQLLHQPGSYLRHFEDYLATSFPSIRIRTKIVKDAPTYLEGQPFLYYGDPWTSHAPFWHLDMVLEMPVITSTILRHCTDSSVVLRVDEEGGEEAEE
jgi:hypothetical protein